MNERFLNLARELGAEVTPGTLRVEKGPLLDAAGVAERIRAFAPEQGWLQFTDRVVLLDELEDGELDSGRLLAAELARDDVSLHIRWQNDGWLAWEIHRRDGDDLLLQQNYLATSRAAGKKLRYQTCWQRDEAGELRPALSRFVGFVEGGE